MSSTWTYVIYDDLSSDNEDTLNSWIALAATEYISQYPKEPDRDDILSCEESIEWNEAKCPDMFIWSSTCFYCYDGLRQRNLLHDTL